MKKTLLTLCCFSALTLNAQTPTFDWAINIGSTNFDKGYDIATDAAGNVYEIGILAGTADFDPGAGVVNLASNAARDAISLAWDYLKGNVKREVILKEYGGYNLDTGLRYQGISEMKEFAPL